MILIVDLCGKEDSLSYSEYVNPIAEIVKSLKREFRILHYSELTKDLAGYADAVILCGTALMDNKFLEDSERLDFISDLNIPVLGICAGAQLLAKIFGGNITSGKKIGMGRVKKTADDFILGENDNFEGYELHGNSFEVPDDFYVIAESDSGAVVIRHHDKQIYGVVFHPEVRNEWVVERFLEISG